MGGGGRKGIIGGYGEGPRKEQQCENIEFDTQLFSPDPKVVSNIKRGDELQIELGSGRKSLVVVFKGQLAGTLLGKYLIQLIDCIDKGYIFIAIVKNIEGGNCNLKIKTKT